ncbi:MAG: hypothetical protein GTN69_06860 [Armatimonadetes bacterium]|nr:hypothetical protein [Armatimonadota bacterium]NIO75592.1 hypothetical protein [Armatimonadota bacterium]NIO98646.1 hypothetical protein [Armatimonadota bacterium]
MKLKPLKVLLAGCLAAALFAAGVKGYWMLQDSLAAAELRTALYANYLQGRQGIARTMVSTPGGWLVSEARIDYRSPKEWKIEYLNPRLANARIAHQGGYLWRRSDLEEASVGEKALPQVIRTGAPSREPTSIQTSLANYRVRHLGSDMVAGRPVKIIGLEDRKSGSLLRVFWVDKASKVMLRQDRLGEGGGLISSTQFLQISLLPPRSRALDGDVETGEGLPPASGQRMSLPELSRRVGFHVLLPGRLPKGFRLRESYLFPCPCGCGTVFAHLRFTDEVRGFSVFQMKHTEECGLTDSIAENAGQPFPSPIPGLKAAASQRGEVLIVVIGDLEVEMLERIAVSF